MSSSSRGSAGVSEREADWVGANETLASHLKRSLPRSGVGRCPPRTFVPGRRGQRQKSQLPPVVVTF